MTSRGILIAGGYGVVGRRIAANLAPDYPSHVIVGGRSRARAEETATVIGHGVRGRTIDVSDPSSISDALQGVDVVISCIDQPGRKLLRSAIERGLRYIDIAPRLTELGRGAAYDEIQTAAAASGARVVLGTGIVPGISNVMVRVLADELKGADEIEIALLLSASDVTGPASLDYFLQELPMSFDIRVDGEEVHASAFSAPRMVEFPKPAGAHLSYLFPFSDQVLYPRTLGARTARTRLAIEPSWLSWLLALIVRTGASRFTAIETVRQAITRRRRNGRANNAAARFSLRVDVRHDDHTRSATLLGRGQADAAAAGAAAVARQLVEGLVSDPGAWMPEQVIEPSPFLSQLANQGLRIEFPDLGQ